MITFTTRNIPGLSKTIRSDGTPVWKLMIQFRGRRWMKSHMTLEDAIQYYREEKLRQTFLKWPPFTEAELQVFTDLLNRQPDLRSVLSPILAAALAAYEPTESLSSPGRSASHQRGLPKNQRQKGTGGQVDPDILFHTYARRWFEANRTAWTTSTQDATRSLCTKHLNPVFGGHRLCDITANMVEHWLRDQLKSYSLALCQNMRKALASIFYAAIADGVVSANPVTDPRCMLPTYTTRQRLQNPH